MFVRTVTRRTRLWPAALTAATSAAPGTLAGWADFFTRLQLPYHTGEDGCGATAASTVSETVFDLVPAPLLRSIAQTWVDAWVLAVTSEQLAQVYPPARAALPSSSPQSPPSSLSPLPSAASEAELLLANWTAHVLLASLHENLQQSALSPAAAPSPASPSALSVSSTLAECLRADVAPVLGYLTSHGATTASPARVLHRAFVLLLASFASTWRHTGTQHVPRPRVSRAELSLAQELCRCVEALGVQVSSVAGTADGPPDDFAAMSDAYYAAARGGLPEVTCRFLDGANSAAAGVTSTGSDGTDSETPLWTACEAWIAEQAATASLKRHNASTFAGITGVPAPQEESAAVLDQVHRQLNSIAQSSRAPAPF